MEELLAVVDPFDTRDGDEFGDVWQVGAQVVEFDEFAGFVDYPLVLYLEVFSIRLGRERYLRRFWSRARLKNSW